MKKFETLQKFVEMTWDNSIVPTLKTFIGIPNKSPLFDTNWEKHGYMEQAVSLVVNWCKQQPIQNMNLEVVRLPSRTPLLFIEIQGQQDNTILLYGHLDKQPEFSGWRSDLNPWQATLENDKLYGRGAADDGYAVFSALTAISALQQQNIPHARCIILIETCEESGSYDLPFYMSHLATRIKNPKLVIGLDAGCGNYDQFWCTTSLRGIVAGDLTVKVLSEGVHSGNASGIVPSSFRILRQLLSRIEDEKTGYISLSELHAEIPHQRILQAKAAATVLQNAIINDFPFLEAVKPVPASSGEEVILNRTWRPALSYIGCEGIPPLNLAGNVLRPYSTLRLSFRIPPTCDPLQAYQALKLVLERDPPYQSQVEFKLSSTAKGWNAPEPKPWLTETITQASWHFFKKESMYMGEGASIPFIAMLSDQFPTAEFVITGVLGPHANAHGPNEFLHIPTVKKLTCCIAEIIAKHFEAQ